MDVIQIYESLGTLGVFQVTIFSLTCIVPVVAGILIFSSAFLLAVPNHRCFVDFCDQERVLDNLNQDWVDYTLPPEQNCYKYKTIGNNCSKINFINETEKCRNWVYDSTYFENTITTEWNLFCDQRWVQPFAQSLFMASILICSLLFGLLSDNFGRRQLHMWAPLVIIICLLNSYFTKNVVIFLLLYSIAIGFSAGLLLISYVIGIEFMSSQFRSFIGSAHQVLFAVGELILCLLANYYRDFRELTKMILIISLSLLATMAFPETLRWQVSQGRTKDACKTLVRVAKWNRKPIPDLSQNKKALNIMENNLEVKPVSSSAIFKVLFGKIWSLVLFLQIFFTSMIYYGLSFGVISDLKKNNPYTIFALLAMIEIPFIAVCAFAMKYFGRKKPLGFFLLVSGLCCLSSIFVVKYDSSSSVLLLMFSKGAISAACTTVYVYSGELYPTDIRNTALGVCSVFSRLGGMICPFVIALKFAGPETFLWIIGSSSLLLCIFLIYLPETHNRKLPEKIEDLEVCYNKS